MHPVHVNDIAGVSSNLVAAARELGSKWSLWPVPAGRGTNPVVPLAQRAVDLAKWRRARRGYDVLHIHYGVTGYYGWGAPQPVVLHLHGTDIRADLRSRWLGPVVRRSLRTADVVLYSTPDLAPEVHRHRPDATWFPAPVPLDVLAEPAPPAPTGAPRVLFSGRWDDSKGGRGLVDLARALRAARPDVELVGIDWGTFRQEAADAGVTMLPLQDEASFRRLMAGAHVVVGQFRVGLLGVADLQALVLGRPLVGHFDDAFVGPGAYDRRPPLVQAHLGEEAVGAVLGALDDPPRTDDAGRRWVSEYHAPVPLAARLADLYAGLRRG